MKTNPTQCFTKKNEFGFALFGGSEVAAWKTKQNVTYTYKDGKVTITVGAVA